MSDLHSPTADQPANGAEPHPSKRQRRPSVRLGDIGGGGAGGAAGADLVYRRPKSHLKFLPNPIPNPKFPKRPRKNRSTTLALTTSSKPPLDDEEDEGFRSEFDDLQREDSLSPLDRRAWNEEEDHHNGVSNVGLGEEGGVLLWLNRLGLGRYAPMFEIHEVDDEVLPMLTLEDLKDIGINAVGARRKMFSAIQKLNKNIT